MKIIRLFILLKRQPKIFVTKAQYFIIVALYINKIQFLKPKIKA
jgi:hypothetical protein